MGTYTDITIIAPSSALAGTNVNVELRVLNLSSLGFNVYAIGILDASPRFINWVGSYLGAGQIKSFYGNFIMPNRNAVINAYTYYEAANGMLYSDDETSKPITVESIGAAEFRSLVCSYTRG